MNVLCPISLNPAMTTCSDRKPRPLVVELAAGYRHECLEVRRREQADGVFRRDDRQAPEGILLLEGGVDGEGDDLAGAVEGEILVGEIGRLPRPEDDDAIGLCHDLKSGRFS